MQWLKLIGAVLVIVSLCGLLLPRLAQVPQFEVVRHNIESDIDATAYFYSDMDDFDRFEQAVREKRNTNR